MQTGALGSYIDLAQVLLYVFWIFFAGLIYYLQREMKREGYPLDSDRTARAPRIAVQGFPSIPQPKAYKLADGSTAMAPNGKRDAREIKARPVAPHPGAPLEPTGDPMIDGVGPAAYAQRADVPDLTMEGDPRIVPLRVARDHVLESRDPDPRGMPVVGADRRVGGVVRDVWVDRSEAAIRYLEVETADGARRVLLPINFTRIKRNEVNVKAILAKHFAQVPRTRQPDRITRLEEERITAFYGGGTLYAEPARQEPLL